MANSVGRAQLKPDVVELRQLPHVIVNIRANADPSRVASVSVDKGACGSALREPLVDMLKALSMPIIATVRVFDSRGVEIHTPEDFFHGGTYFVEPDGLPFDPANRGVAPFIGPSPLEAEAYGRRCAESPELQHTHTAAHVGSKCLTS
jgi:hypothetical protein